MDFLKVKDNFPGNQWCCLCLIIVKNSKFNATQYDAILIDEAQDFAPSWIKVVNYLLKENGVLFITDDPYQSIYRYFSWRQKGIEVVGRTRRLRVPYRNTRQIFTAASAILKGDEELLEQMQKEGDYVEPDLSNQLIREGKKPLLKLIRTEDEKIQYIENEINYLRQKLNIPYSEMAILHPKRNKLKLFREKLGKYGLEIDTCYAVKSLQYEAVFLCGLDHFFQEEKSDDRGYLSTQKRIIYMAMGRARNHLYLIYNNSLPKLFSALDEYVTHLIV